jgi:hypothetical protein
MSSGIVKRIKHHHHIYVANALFALGYRWPNPKRRPTNIERMLEGLPRDVLLAVLHRIELAHGIGAARKGGGNG